MTKLKRIYKQEEIRNPNANKRKKQRNKISYSTREKLVGFAFVAPFLVGFLAFFIVPFIVSISYTFTIGTSGTIFVGLQNYIDVFSSDAFVLAAKNTFMFILIGVPLIMIIAMVFSLLLQKTFKGSTWFRSAFLYPLIVPIASTVMVFEIIFADSGILNTVLGYIGIPVQYWLNSPNAFAILVGLYIWKNCGYNIILLLSGLNSIPHELYEAAKLDGATSFNSFRYITMPIISPTFFFVFVISIINSFKSFREAFLLSGNMPHKSIYMLQHFMNNNFNNLNYQRLSVAAFIIFFVVFILIFVMFRLRRKAGDVEL